ncbi:MAG: hypothetical protein ACXV5H_11970 [Halobacteriota archaeon]
MAIIKKRVGREWTWFEDYVYATATYTCFTPANRSVQIGMGIFVADEPRGEKVAVSGKGEFTVIGAGAIHIRIYDDGPDCEVAVTQERNIPVPILRGNF